MSTLRGPNLSIPFLAAWTYIQMSFRSYYLLVAVAPIDSQLAVGPYLLWDLTCCGTLLALVPIYKSTSSGNYSYGYIFLFYSGNQSYGSCLDLDIPFLVQIGPTISCLDLQIRYGSRYMTYYLKQTNRSTYRQRPYRRGRLSVICADLSIFQLLPTIWRPNYAGTTAAARTIYLLLTPFLEPPLLIATFHLYSAILITWNLLYYL